LIVFQIELQIYRQLSYAVQISFTNISSPCGKYS